MNHPAKMVAAVVLCAIIAATAPTGVWGAMGQHNLRTNLNRHVHLFLEALQRESAAPQTPAMLHGKHDLKTKGPQADMLRSLGGQHRLLGGASLLPARPNQTLGKAFAYQPALSESKTKLYSFFTAVDLGTMDYPQPPYEPSDPNPADGATNVAVTGVSLSWSGGDPNAGDTVVYDIYWGTSPDFTEPYSTNYPDTTFALPDMQYNTTYYWMIRAFDGQFETFGQTWHYSTIAGTPPPTSTPTNAPTATASPTPTPADSTAPVSLITAPLEGDLIAGFTYTITGTALDNEDGSGVNLVEVSTDGGATWAAATGLAEWTFAWTITADGPYSLQSRATDVMGNVEVPAVTVHVTIDNTPPLVMAAGWWDTEITKSAGGNVTLVALCQDTDVAKVEVLYAGTPVGLELKDDGTQGDLAAGDTLYMFSAPVGPGTDTGSFLIEVAATDNAGNRSMIWPYFEIYGTDIYGAPPRSGKVSWLKDYQKATSMPADGQRPQIFVGGYWTTRVSSTGGGDFIFLSYVLDPQGPSDIAMVELYYMGQSTSVQLFDDGQSGDWNAGDGVFSVGFPFPAGTPAQTLLLEVKATDRSGNQSMMYPYLEIFN